MTKGKAERKTASDAKATDEGQRTFEDAVRRLGEIVERLEGGELPLEESLTLFEEGVRLARTSQARLDAAEKRVEELLGIDERSGPVVRELDPD
jgi:exodeoxyribonuclease VII small subunit